MLAKLLGNVAIDGGQDQRPDSSVRRYPYTGIREFYGILVGDFEGQPSLKNVEKDWRNLRPALEFCGFETSNEHCKLGNINSEEAKAFIEISVAKARQKDSDMICWLLSSHGFMKDNMLHVQFSDKTYESFEKLIEPILTCKELIGKPKIFICLLCRGDQNLTQGVVPKDAAYNKATDSYIHQTKDRIIIYSSQPGNLSFHTDDRGSPVADSLAKNLREFGRKESLRDICDRMCEDVTNEMPITIARNGNIQKFVQAPEISACLTRRILFTNPNSPTIEVRAVNFPPHINFPPLFPSENKETVVQQPDVPPSSTPIKNWIGRLQEHAQENKKPNPIYAESHEAGANGNFTCKVTFGGKTITGSGHPKKRAKQEAARLMCEHFGIS